MTLTALSGFSPSLLESDLFQVRILNRALRPLVVVDNYVSISWTRSWQEGNRFALVLYNHLDHFGSERRINPAARFIHEDYYVQVRWRASSEDEWAEEFLGLIEHAHITLDRHTDRHEIWDIRGASLLARRITVPPVGAASDTRQGPAESVIKGWIDFNLVNPTTPERKLGALVIEEDQFRGQVIVKPARYEKLLDKVIEAARSGNIGWELVGGDTGMEFRMLPGVDRSTTQSANTPVVFDPALGNIFMQEYVWSMLHRATTAYVGGDGEGAEREIVVVNASGVHEGLSDFNSLFLEGVDSRIVLDPEVSVKGQSKAGVEGWVYFDDLFEPKYIWHESQLVDNNGRFQLYVTTGGNLHLTLRTGEGGPQQFETTQTIPVDTWAHVAAFVNLDSDDVDLHVFVPNLIDVKESFVVNGTAFPGSTPMGVWMGYEPVGGTFSRVGFSEWRLWHLIRSDATIAANRFDYVQGVTTNGEEFAILDGFGDTIAGTGQEFAILDSGVEDGQEFAGGEELPDALWGYWRFDDAAGNLVRDYSAQGNDGEIDGVFYWAAGDITGGNPVGASRREMWVDARDASGEASLIDRGIAKLREQGPKARLSAQVNPMGMFRYRADWNLGDICTIRNQDWGVTSHLRIHQIEVTLEPGHTPEIDVSFGPPFPGYTELVVRELQASVPSLRI